MATSGAMRKNPASSWRRSTSLRSSRAGRVCMRATFGSGMSVFDSPTSTAEVASSPALGVVTINCHILAHCGGRSVRRVTSAGQGLAPTGLPVEDVIPELRSALGGGTAVLTAEAGAGKTTVVPLRLLDEDWLGDRRIVVLEPRRVAARAAAIAHVGSAGRGRRRDGRLRDER